MSLEELRTRIDQADEKIVRLIAERIRAAGEIGDIKKEQGRQIEDTSREKKVLQQISDVAAEEGLNPEDITRLFRQIMTIAKSVEGTVIAFQGEAGAYSEEAAYNYFSSSVTVKPCETLAHVFNAVETGQAQCGIIPIENSLEGNVGQSYDLLLDTDLNICGETELRVVHCLITHPGTKLEDIKRIYSHPQALGQCQAFLKHLNCELIPATDTAGSVKMIKEKGIIDAAAIASARASEIYGMQILAKEIEDNPYNYTRFLVIKKEKSPPSGRDKTSIVFSVEHQPGSLFRFLKIMTEGNLNMTKIQSRPTRQKPWQYNMYLDFEGHCEDEEVKKTLEKMKGNALFLKVLGSYPEMN
ncbi:MAG: prephenate dehydratase [Dehalococcoidales bacterium]|nr:prephenate dehydratase [Dehalococcoidales bacterium]